MLRRAEATKGCEETIRLKKLSATIIYRQPVVITSVKAEGRLTASDKWKRKRIIVELGRVSSYLAAPPLRCRVASERKTTIDKSE
jgi:hypothetical protein